MKTRKIPLLLLAGLWGACGLHAQDVEKVFDDFARQQQQAFEEFKSKADAEFETFLRETWQKYEAFEPIPAPQRPEPPQPSTFDPSRPLPEPVAVRPGVSRTPQAPVPDTGDQSGLPSLQDRPAPGVYVPGKPYTPVIVPAPVVRPGCSVYRTPVEFYGTFFEVAVGVAEDLVLTGNTEADVADAWKKLCSADYEQMVSDCMKLKSDRLLSDWAYLLFTRQLGLQLYGADRPDEVAFLQMFLLSKSGYKVRLAKIDDRLKLMVAPAGTIYSTPYLTIGGNKYYVFEPAPGGSMSIYTYRQDFADAKNLVSLNLAGNPDFDKVEHRRQLSTADGKLKVQAVVNQNLIDFYHDYPQCDVLVHYKAPMSEELRSVLYPQLREAIAGLSQKDAANRLLDFVQTSFAYMTDGEQFGYEKPNFPDETFYYPYCDCEDRAMLYSTLVSDLMGLKTILLDYPNHIASAVRFTEEVAGDYIVLDNGDKYLICDPTYIGAPIGTCMDEYKQVAPQIIF